MGPRGKRRRCRWRTPDRKLDEDDDIRSDRPVPPIRFAHLSKELEMIHRLRQRSPSAARSRRSCRLPALSAGLLLAIATSLHADATNPSPAAAGKVNINQATAEQIAMLPRIGAKVATRVLDYRKSHGPFAKPENLMEVKGIGEKLFLTLKPYLAVSGPTTLAAKVRLGSSRRREASSPAAKAAPKSAPASVPAGKGR
jgi:competence protein ComEA